MAENLDNPYDSLSVDTGPELVKGCRTRGVEIAVVAAIGLILVGLLLPATRSVPRHAIRRMQCSNNLKQLGLALQNYAEDFRQLPPAYTTDANGKPLHSWRTLILPYLEQSELYAKVDLTKPWDDPANDEVRNAAIPVYQCPESKLPKGHTTYLTVITTDSCLQPSKGRSMSQIKDGKENTLLVYESNKTHSVHWMSPQDADLEMFLSLNAKSMPHLKGRNAVFVNCHISFLSDQTSRDDLRGMITIDGGEAISFVAVDMGEPFQK